MTAYVIGGLSAALLISVVILVVQNVLHGRALRAALQHESRLLDRARAAELRSAQQIDALLDRISTSPRIEVRPTPESPPISGERNYITDEPYMDAAWNEHRGEPETESS